jgi:integration host factor subunit alpha
MTKADLVENLYEKLGISKKECAELVDKFFELIKESLRNNEKVMISGFGTFIPREKKERKGRNPKTGETITIAPRRVLTFRLSQVFKKRLNGSS